MSNGIISAKRTLPGSQVEVFQITAPISQGSSGGALLNSRGEVVGVPFVQMVSGQNLNFAIPITYFSPLIVNAPPRPFPSISSGASGESTSTKATIVTFDRSTSSATGACHQDGCA